MVEKNGVLASKVFLLKEMVVRDVRARYAGSGLGILWAFALPILWMLLYTGVFSLVLKVPVEAGFASFPEFLMAALLPWMAVSEGISRSATCLIDNAAMVKKTVFPLELLVLSVVLAAVVNEVIALAIYAAYVALIGHLSLLWLILIVPALAFQILLTFGIGCIAAASTAFLRDAAHAVNILLTVGFYATPIVYPVSLVPPRLFPFIEANPMAHLVDLYRRAFTLHAAPAASSVAYLATFSFLAAALGGMLFARARPHFADLL
jgi:lipopolysaccharide transport system permease protein